MPIRIVNDNEEFDNENSNNENHQSVISFLKVGSKEYNIIDGYIIGTFVENEYEQLVWTIEVQIDSEEELFEAFSNIVIPEGFTIEEISNTSLEDEEELLNLIEYEGNLLEEIFEITSVHFEDYEIETNQIPCTIQAQLNDGSEYFLQAELEFRGYYYFTHNKESVKTFVNDYLGYELEEVEIEYEKQEDDSWMCIIF